MPKATMFVWASIPERYKAMGSLEFSKKLLTEAKVAVSPGVGFGEYGDEHVRFSLIENEERTRQACGASSRCSSRTSNGSRVSVPRGC
jgi:alanine-synthesizing transaminase